MAGDFEKVSDRYQPVRFEREIKSEKRFQFRLESETFGQNLVYVDAENMPPGDASSVKEIFLTRKSLSQNWYGVAWSRSINPWANDRLPKHGQVLVGVVRRFIHGDSAILGVRFRGLVIECEVPRKRLMQDYKGEDLRQGDIRSLLYEGDIIAGCVAKVLQDTLTIELSVQRWYQLQEQAWKIDAARKGTAPRAEKTATETAEATAEIADHKISRVSLEANKVLIIDDNEPICDWLARELEAVGASVWKASGSDPNLLDNAMRGLGWGPDRIVLDQQLSDDKHVEDQILAAVQSTLEDRPETKVLMISGNNETAKKRAVELEFGFLPKPLSLPMVIDWIADPESVEIAASPVSREENQMFAVESRTQITIEKANALLEKLSTRHDFLGAFWVVEVVPGVFELRAHTASVSGRVTIETLSDLVRSTVGRAIREERTATQRLSNRDPLADVFGKEAEYAVCVPVLLQNHAPRCITFFSRHPVPHSIVASLEERVDHFALLIEAISQSEAVDEIQASAMQGRRAFSTLHELRTLLTPILGQKVTLQNYEELSASTREIRELVIGELRDFRPVVPDNATDLVEVVRNTTRMMNRFLKDREAGRIIEIIEDLPTGPIHTHVNRMVVDRVLSNLIENSFAFIADLRVQKIWVKMARIANAGNYQVRISVEDSGPGVPTVTRPHIFLPRRSGRPQASTGMGLYLSMEMIKSLGGELVCDPRPRFGGASFSILLPLKLGDM